MNKKTLKIAGWALGLSMAVVGIGTAAGASNAINGAEPMMVKAEEIFKEIDGGSIDSGTVVSSTAYRAYSNDDWLITFGGNSKSVGTNSNNRANCNLSVYSQYAVSPVSTSDVASAFVSKKPFSGVSKISYTFSGGSGQNDTNVYLIYSSDNETFSQIDLTTGTQGATISSGTEFVFDELTGYFGVLFKATNSSGNWRIDDVGITLYEKQEAKAISNIALSEGPGLKKDYVDGDSVDVSNIVATATYSDGSQGTANQFCSITADIENVTLETTSITYSAIYNGEDVVPDIDDLVVNVSVVPISVSSLTKYGTIKVDFAENEAFGLGNGKIQINYNNGKYERVGLEKEDLAISLGGDDITGHTYYVQTSDVGKEVTISYGGQSYSYNIETVTAAEETEEGYYQLVTSESEIDYDDVVVIASSSSDGSAKALSTTQNNNNRGVADVTISSGKITTISASVQTLTLTDTSSTVASSFGLYTGSGYLYAASSSSNYLRTQANVDKNACFTITFEDSHAADLVAQGENSHNTIRFNTTLFSCYESGQKPVYLYKFVSESKSADQVAVEGFVDEYMHLDDVSINDHGDTNACRDFGTGAKGYYASAKEAYNDDEILTDEQRILFRTSEVFKIQRGYERLRAWAEANNDSFNDTNNKLETKQLGVNALPTKSSTSNPILIIVITISISALATAGMFLLHKKKED